MNTISVSTRAVAGYVAERSIYKPRLVVKAEPEAKLWHSALQKNRTVARLEDMCMALLTAGGISALAYGLSLAGVLSVRWPQIENTLNSLIR